MLNTLTRQLLPLPALAFAFVLAGPSPAAAQDAARGAEVYAAQKCSICHAIAGKGKAANPLDGVGAKLSAADIKQWIVESDGDDGEDQVDQEAADADQVQRPAGRRHRRARRLPRQPEVAPS